MYDTMNDVIVANIQKKIAKSQPKAMDAINRLIEEGKISRDFIAPIGVNLKRREESPVLTFEGNGQVIMHMQHEDFNLHPHAVTQIGEKLGIPTAYLRGLAVGDEWQRKLAARIMNDHSGWTDRSRVLVRAVGNEVRGVLSDHYKRMNSSVILTAFAKECENNGAIVVDGFMDDTKLWFEAIMPEPIPIPTKMNGVVQVAFGIRISSSDYGDGALELRSFMLQGVCLNGMVRQSVLRQKHLGARLPDDLRLSERTYRLDTSTQKSLVVDLTNQLLLPETIERRAIEIQEAAGIEVDFEKELKSLEKGKLRKDEVVEVQRVLMNSKEEDGTNGANSLWKLVNGITAHARNVEPRRERELHEIAGSLMDRLRLQ